jgi:hypothetical protein
LTLTAFFKLILPVAVLHPYYKLDFIKLTWGGAEGQARERAAGNPDAKNWQDEAWKVIESVVSDSSVEDQPSHVKQPIDGNLLQKDDKSKAHQSSHTN